MPLGGLGVAEVVSAQQLDRGPIRATPSNRSGGVIGAVVDAENIVRDSSRPSLTYFPS